MACSEAPKSMETEESPRWSFGREDSRRERNVLVGPDAQLVWSTLIIKDVLLSIVMTQVGSIPHGEVTGPHTGPRKPRDTLD